MTGKFSILHLSDLHFGEIEGTPFAHKWLGSTEGLVEKCRDAVEGHLLNFVVISGDLVCDGSKLSQHEDAKRNILKLCGALKVTPDRLIIIPGNHEVDRTEADDGKRLSHFRKVLGDVYSAPHLQTRVPPESWDSHADNDHGWNPVVSVPGFPVDFILLYSCFTSKDKLVPNNFKKKNIW